MSTSSLAAISIDMGGTKIFGVVQGFSGEVVAEQSLPTHGEDGTAEGFDQLIKLVEALRAHAEQAGVGITGIGLGVPGMTRDGVVIAAPALGWLDEPVVNRLNAACGLPVALENDVNLAALGEYHYGAAKGAASMVCVAVGTGIGAGIVIDGKLVRGAHNSAGEIGYLVVDPTQFQQTFAHDDFGAFEQLASGTGIQTRAAAALAGQPAEGREAVTSEQVVAAAQRGEGWAQTVVDETVAFLALGLTNITAVIDPEVIVLTGGVMRAAELFVVPLAVHLERLIPFRPRLAVSTLGPRAATYGATALVASVAS